jgi:uncharacterized cupin superfamily protein
MMPAQILNLDQVDFKHWGHSERYQARLGEIATRLGARKLGYRLIVLPPGKAAWPYHAHHVNEEMFFILEGTGTLRYSNADYPLRAGDVIACPVDPNGGHQIRNSSTADLRYLAVSTMEYPEIARYPDSGKFAAITAPADAPDRFAIWAPESAGVDYWTGES